MNGNSLFLDTNIVLYFLSGDELLLELLAEKELYISFITELELFCLQKMSEEQEQKVMTFLDLCEIVNINIGIKRNVIDIRRKYKKIKMPDSIIAASANYMNIPLITADKDFEKIKEIDLILYK